jgi:hypothetical protein
MILSRCASFIRCWVAEVKVRETEMRIIYQVLGGRLPFGCIFSEAGQQGPIECVVLNA